MIARWGHLHSLAVGGLLTLMLATHLWTLLVLVFAMGVLVRALCWGLLSRAAGLLRSRLGGVGERRVLR